MAKILLVEDDAAIANLYQAELKLRDHSVIYSNNGENLVELVKKEKPDIILLDIQLPQKDGLTLLSELKSNGDTKDVKVIVLSNYASQENVDKALQMGAIDFIPKHRIVPEELGIKIEQLV